MATIEKEFEVPAPAASVWDVVRDFGAADRLARGFVTACTPEEDGAMRLVTFANGIQARERLVTRDDAARRLVYTVVDGRPTHYNGVVRVSELGPQRCRFAWTVDLLPDALAPAMAQMMEHGARAMQAALTPAAR